MEILPDTLIICASKLIRDHALREDQLIKRRYQLSLSTES